jgi:signal transduction histidine kinase
MLQQPPDLAPPVRRRLARAVAAVDEIGGALEAARAMAGRRVTQQGEVDVRACVDDAWASVRARALRAAPVLDNQIARQTVVLADRHALLTILRNLMRNAVEHATAAHCRVRLTERGLEVLDDGSGIPPEDLPNIFERFYRGRMVDTRAGGPGAGEPAQRGIGLAIARQLADLNGWTLTAHAAPELDPSLSSGTAFVLGIRRLA